MDESKRCAERCKTGVWLNRMNFLFIRCRESGPFSPINVREFRCDEADMALAHRGNVEITLIQIIAHLKDYLEVKCPCNPFNPTVLSWPRASTWDSNKKASRPVTELPAWKKKWDREWCVRQRCIFNAHMDGLSALAHFNGLLILAWAGDPCRPASLQMEDQMEATSFNIPTSTPSQQLQPLNWQQGVKEGGSVQGAAESQAQCAKQQSDADHRLLRPVVTGAKRQRAGGQLLVRRGRLNVNYQ